jgi:hypothetical protein
MVARALPPILVSGSVAGLAGAEPSGRPDAKAEAGVSPPAKGAEGEASAADRGRARQLFEEATELENQRDFRSATAKLEQALEIVETPGLRYHLAYCQEEQGLMVEALGNYERAQQMIAAGAKAPDVAELLAPKRDSLLERVPKLRLRARAPAVIERVAVDGAIIAPGLVDQPILLNPGRHRVIVWARGVSTPLEREIPLGERREHTEEFVWPPLAAVAARPAAPPRVPAVANDAPEPDSEPVTGVSARSVVLITEASLTAVALGVGIGFQVRARDAKADGDAIEARLPPGNSVCNSSLLLQVARDCKALEDARRRQGDHQTIGNIALVTAAGGAIATVATWILWKPAPDGAAVGVNLTPTTGGGALELHGRF